MLVTITHYNWVKDQCDFVAKYDEIFQVISCHTFAQPDGTLEILMWNGEKHIKKTYQNDIDNYTVIKTNE